jgi:hypothetical protein
MWMFKFSIQSQVTYLVQYYHCSILSSDVFAPYCTIENASMIRRYVTLGQCYAGQDTSYMRSKFTVIKVTENAPTASFPCIVSHSDVLPFISLYQL